MITNDRVARLIDTDRQALVELMAAAYALGAQRGFDQQLWYDREIRELIEDMRRLVAQPQRSTLAVDQWNAWAAAPPDVTMAAVLATSGDAAGAIATADEVTR